MKKYKLFLISCLSGVLLSLAWPEKGFAPLLWVAFLPLLWVEDYISKDKSKRFGRFAGFFYSYIPFLIWNVATTYWVYYASPVAIVAFTANSLLMAIAFQLYHYTKKRLYNGKGAYFVLVIYWLGFEFFHLNCWDLSWPWLTLGNGFATMPSLIQWYEMTGILGGSLWILCCNITLFALLKTFLEKQAAKQKKIWGISAVACILVPILISVVFLKMYKEPTNAEDCDVVVVQPNLDPYEEQYSYTPEEVTEKLITLSKPYLDSNTDFIITPESALQEYIYESELVYSPCLNHLREFVSAYPKLSFLVGMASRDILPPGKETYAMRPCRNFGQEGMFYECYNTALLVENTKDYQFLHKSKLTPGVEIMPYIKNLGFLSDFAIDLGGTIGSLGVSDERKVFTSTKNGTRIAAIICYESIYGDYIARYARQGIDAIFIITNDGWWKNTPGHRQHVLYSRLRAIEFRKWIARSANTGISAFVSPTGKVTQHTQYWEEAVLKQTIKKDDRITFYARYGDYLGRIALISSGFLFLITFVRKRLAKAEKNGKNRKNTTK